jgi:Flp pilus assembly protein TadG
MKTASRHFRQRQGGVAAIEFALVLPIFVALLVFTVFFGRVMWHYNVALKAAHDAATSLALATKIEISTKKSDLGEVEIANVSRIIATTEVAELSPGNGTMPVIDVTCDSVKCIGSNLPSQVAVTVRINIIDTSFASLTNGMISDDGLWLYAEVRMPYAGF